MFKGRIDYTDDDTYYWRHENFGRLLLNAYSYFEQGLMVRFHAMGYDEIRPVHLAVMRNMDIDGTRITVIADRAGVTKQAMSHFVQECEELGFVERTTDPDDGRAKIVVFTAKGRKFMKATKAVIEAIEKEIIASLGVSKSEVLRASLKELANRLVQEDILLNKK